MITANNHIIANASHPPVDSGTMALLNLVREAIQAQKCLSIQYDGYNRVIEPHAVGITKNGHPIARAWQVSGGSNGNGQTPWKLFRLDRGSHIALLDQDSDAPREGYVPNDRCISVVLAKI